MATIPSELRGGSGQSDYADVAPTQQPQVIHRSPTQPHCGMGPRSLRAVTANYDDGGRSGSTQILISRLSPTSRSRENIPGRRHSLPPLRSQSVTRDVCDSNARTFPCTSLDSHGCSTGQQARRASAIEPARIASVGIETALMPGTTTTAAPGRGRDESSMGLSQPTHKSEMRREHLRSDPIPIPRLA